MPFVLVVALLIVAFPGSAAAVSCGEALTASVTLDADLACGAGDGLIVFGDDVEIDLAGHSISGQGTAINNELGFSRTTVKNGKLSGFEDAILLGGGQGHLVKNMEIRCGVSGVRFGAGTRFSKMEKSRVFGCLGTMISLGGDDNVVTKVTLVRGLGRGMFVSGDRNVVTKSSVTNLGDGIAIIGVASGTVVDGNTLSANQDSGILVSAGGGTGTAITKNRCEGNGEAGILLSTADAAVIGGNTVIGNGIGIRVTASTGVSVTKNVVTANAEDGIVVAADAAGVAITGNKAHRNRSDGIQAESPGTVIAKNAADANGQIGITAPNGGQDGGGNKARDNQAGNCAGPGLACK